MIVIHFLVGFRQSNFFPIVSYFCKVDTLRLDSFFGSSIFLHSRMHLQGTHKHEGVQEFRTPKSWINEKRCVFNKHKVKVFITLSWQCSGTFAPNTPYLMVTLPLCSSGIDVPVVVEGLWRALCRLKKPFKGLRPGLGSCWEEQEKKYLVFTLWQVITLPSTQNNYFSHTAPLCFIHYSHPDCSWVSIAGSIEPTDPSFLFLTKGLKGGGAGGLPKKIIYNSTTEVSFAVF